MVEHPLLAMVVWVGAQIVVGICGYVQGKKDEELKWRRHHGGTPKAIGFRGRS